MITFSAIAAAMLLLSIALVLWPLWRSGSQEGSRREASIAIFEQHAAEIEREIEAGEITPEQGAAHREELGARLLADVDLRPPPIFGGRTDKPWVASAAVVIGIVVLAVGLYGLLGDPRGVTAQSRPNIDQLVARMKLHLDQTPQDLRTRALLAQVQMARHNYAAAAQSWAKINADMGEPDVTFLLAGPGLVYWPTVAQSIVGRRLYSTRS